MTPLSLRPGRPGRVRRFVVCGDSPLAYRLVSELIDHHTGDVTVVLPSRSANQGPQLGQLDRVRLVEAAYLDDAALRAAGVPDADALALLDQDDVANIHAALRASELNADLRLVVRMYNMSLGHRIRTLFADCVMLSDSAMAAPQFVAAALGEVAPSYVRLPGRTLFLARRSEVDERRVVCAVADTSGGTNRLLPADEASADLVLAIADGAPAASGSRRPSRWRTAARRLRFLLANNLVRAGLALVALILAGLVSMATVLHLGWGGALYQTLLDAAGNAVPDNALDPFAKVVQLTVTLSGLALLPVITAVVLDGLVRSRLPDQGVDPTRLADHVVVVGLGNVGTRVVAQLHDLGVPVVCVEPNENARGIGLARRLGLPLVIGDAGREETLRAAGVATSRALLLLTRSDVVNLEAALHGRGLREDLRVVLRLFDDDLADRVERLLGTAVSRSVSRLTAAAFAAAMVQRRVINTMAVDRSALMIAEVTVAPNSPLVDKQLSVGDKPGKTRVIGLWRRGVRLVDWTPSRTYVLAPQDRMIVVATRSGLGGLLERSIAPVPQPDAS